MAAKTRLIIGILLLGLALIVTVAMPLAAPVRAIHLEPGVGEKLMGAPGSRTGA